MARLSLRRQDLPHDLVGVGLALGETLLEFGIEGLQDTPPLCEALLHFVQSPLHVTGELHIEEIREDPDEKPPDRIAQIRGVKALLLDLHIPSILDRGDDLSVGGGAPYPQLLHLPDKARFTEAWRRLREVLLRLESLEIAHIPLLQRRKGLEIVQPPVVSRLLRLPVEAREAGEFLHGAGGPEEVGRSTRTTQIEVQSRGIVDRGRHLACHEAEPDQLV